MNAKWTERFTDFLENFLLWVLEDGETPFGKKVPKLRPISPQKRKLFTKANREKVEKI